MTDPTSDAEAIAHLDFPTRFPFDVELLGQRLAELIAAAPAEALERIRPQLRPGNTTIKFPGNNLVEVWMGPEPIGTIAFAALIRDEDGPPT